MPVDPVPSDLNPEPERVDWVWPMQAAVDRINELERQLQRERDVNRELRRCIAAREREEARRA